MAISSTDLAIIANYAITNYIRTSTDQLTQNRPLLKYFLGKRKKMLAGPGESENIIKDYGSSFAFGYGDGEIEFNERNPTVQNMFSWSRATDAFKISHDRLVAAGIDVHEGKHGEFQTSDNEKAIISNLLADNMYVLNEGFYKNLDLYLHRDGTSDANAIAGLDALISTDPTTGTVGNIDRAANEWWRNYANVSIAADDMVQQMEKAWRECIRHGGTPDFIIAGSDFIDAYRKSITLTQNVDAGSIKKIEGATGSGTDTGVFFKGIQLIWDPTMDDLDSIETTATTKWAKRCYFINSDHIKYKDNGIDITQPTRPYNVLAVYQMLVWRGILTSNRLSAHAVLAVA